MEKQQQGLVFISIPLVGHLIPMVALARRLTPRFHITILTMQAPILSWAASSAAYLQSLRSDEHPGSGSSICFIELPPVDFSIDSNHHAFTTMSLFIDAHKSHVSNAVRGLHVRVAGIVTDFVTSMIDVADELGIPAYIYFPSSAACLSIMVYPPPPFQLLDDMVEVVGISPVPAHALPGPMTDPDGYDTFTYHGRRFNKAKGIIVNTFKELEPEVIKAFVANRSGAVLPPVYPVGPVLSLPSSPPPEKNERHECIRWLDGQCPASVVFLCFGSMGCFEPKQVHEMALGIERSGHRFLWVLRSPSSHGPPVDANLDEVGLPENFLDRTKERGLVWPSWAPQMQILSHEAVGGFVTHCGWNSCLESVWAGVAMLAWPLYAEQQFNACEMVNDIGIAIHLVKPTTQGADADDDGRSKDEGGVGGHEVLGAKEVERGVRNLMGGSCEEGKRVRMRAKEMKEASRRAVEVSGSSYDALELWIRELTAMP